MVFKKAIILIILCVFPSFLTSHKTEYFYITVYKDKTIKEHYNVGSLRDMDGSYKEFKTLDAGVKALKYQIYLYQSGKSHWTDSTTTIKQLIYLYLGHNRGYYKWIKKDLQVEDSTLLYTINADSLTKYIIKYEQGKYFKMLYK